MELYFREYGNGDPVIILHGLLGSSGNWHTVANRLSSQYRVISVDLRNHGQSPHHDDFDYNVMAEDIHKLLIKENIDSAYFMGHSMGGKVAMEFALSYPEKVKKLVVVDIAPVSYDPIHAGLLNILNKLDLSEVSSMIEADSLLHAKIPEPRLKYFLLKNLYSDNNRQFKWKANLTVICRNYLNICNGLDKDRTCTSPVLFIKGQNSDYIEKKDLPFIGCLFPDSDLKIINNAGHWVHSEEPEVFYHTVNEFLN